MNHTETIEIIPIEAQKQIKKIEQDIAQYEHFEIVTNEHYTKSADLLKLIKLKSSEIETLRKSLTKPLDESKKRIMAIFEIPLNKLVKVEIAIKSAMLSWQRKQEEIRRKEEERLAELQRKEAEKLTKKAEQAEAKGNLDKAEDLRQQAQEKEMLTPIVESKIEKVSGIQTKTIWKFKIIDEKLIPREYLIPNETMLGNVARATKGTLKIEGIEFYSEEVIAAGR